MAPIHQYNRTYDWSPRNRKMVADIDAILGRFSRRYARQAGWYRGWPQGNDATRVAGYSASPELIAPLGSDPARRFGSYFPVKLNASGRDYLFTKALNDRVSAMAMNQKGEICLTGFTLDRASRGPGVQPQNRLRRLFRTKASVLALRSSKAGSEYEHFRNARKSVSIRSRSGGRGCGEAIRGGLHGWSHRPNGGHSSYEWPSRGGTVVAP